VAPGQLAWTAQPVLARSQSPELTVGAAATGFPATVMEFRLPVNVELAGLVLDQPSGTVISR